MSGWNSRARGETWFALGVVLLAFALAISDLQFLASFAFVALIVGSALPCRSTDRLFGNPVSLFLGKISFSIYLVHITVLGCVARAVDRFHLSAAPLVERLALTLAIPFGILTMAYLTWRLIEKPSQAFARTRWKTSKSLAAGRCADS
jgi:peptidoglycan/LPS O-acetylase OafA/YrhL